jgi:two-component system sensor histidine kinase CssS
MWNNYRDELVRTLFERIAFILGLLLVVSWIPAILLARYLSRPLVRLEEHVKAIANRELDQPVLIDRKDEIGRLAASIERMRQQLRIHDEAQQSLMQHISHELKTPVMVIRSYAQAIHDGLFPKGDLSSSVEVIEHESSRLEKRIRDLLYLTKLDYLSKRTIKREPVRIDELIRSVIERLRWNRNDLQWEVELDEFEVAVDPEQWNVLLENLLENQIRYASTKIYVKTSSKPLLQIHIGNDGPPLDDEIKSSLFQAFRKGSKGQFGLGLTIAKRIADLHGVNLEAENEDHGVSFTLTFP